MKALRFLGIALLACSMMFVSCKKDNPKPDNNNNQSENPGGGGETNPSGVTINFNGGSWNAANMVAVDKSSQGYMYTRMYKTENSDEDITVSGYLQTNVGEYNYQTSQGDCMYYTDPNFTYIDQTGQLGELLQDEDAAPGTEYSGWLSLTGGDNFTENITAIDLNALTMNATFNQVIIKTSDVVDAGYQVPSTRYNLIGNLNNAKWTWYSAKKDVTKKVVKAAFATK
jgi:hypothetical protein